MKKFTIVMKIYSDKILKGGKESADKHRAPAIIRSAHLQKFTESAPVNVIASAVCSFL